MNKKIRVRVLRVIFGLLFLGMVYRIACFLFEGLIPERRTLYLSYSSFLRDAKRTHFMVELPKSATRTKYFHQVFFFTYENGYGTVIPEEDFEVIKEQYLGEKEKFINQLVSYKYVGGQSIELSEEERKKNRDAKDIYCIENNDKPKPIVADVLEQNNVDFFNKIARQDVREGNYDFLWYWIEDVPGTQFVFSGIIYNNETNEIIELNYWRMDLSNM